ncbi:MAG: hypothetical protein ACYCOU_20835 [Sulfobacillus sp.]
MPWQVTQGRAWSQTGQAGDTGSDRLGLGVGVHGRLAGVKLIFADGVLEWPKTIHVDTKR